MKQLIEGAGGLAPMLNMIAASVGGQTAGGQAAMAGITVGQVFGNYRVVCVDPNRGWVLVPKEATYAPKC